MHVLTYTDSRYGDTFNIAVDETTQRFIGVQRFVDRIGADPIEYFNLEEIPPIHRKNVERKIREYFNPTSNHSKPSEVSQHISEQDGSAI